MFDKSMLLYFGIMLIAVMISSISQVLLKKSAMKEYETKLKEYMNSYVIASYFLLTISTILSVIALRGMPLSMGSMLESASYIFVTFFGVIFFHEKIGAKKIAGLGLIVIGVFVYSAFG